AREYTGKGEQRGHKDIAEITTTMNKVMIQDELHIKDSIDTTKTTNNLETAEETMKEITTEDQMRITLEIAETTKLNKHIEETWGDEDTVDKY
ncbi:4678_t:CDS:2, partial [Rhizophagus irregularis]